MQKDWNADLPLGLAFECLFAGIEQQGGPLQGGLKGDYETNTIHIMAVKQKFDS